MAAFPTKAILEASLLVGSTYARRSIRGRISMLLLLLFRIPTATASFTGTFTGTRSTGQSKGETEFGTHAISLLIDGHSVSCCGSRRGDRSRWTVAKLIVIIKHFLRWRLFGSQGCLRLPQLLLLALQLLLLLLLLFLLLLLLLITLLANMDKGNKDRRGSSEDREHSSHGSSVRRHHGISNKRKLPPRYPEDLDENENDPDDEDDDPRANTVSAHDNSSSGTEPQDQQENDEPLDPDDEARKLTEKRAYNRRNAARARQRVKDQLADLSQKVDSYVNKCSELERDNKKLSEQNKQLGSENEKLRRIVVAGSTATGASAVPASASSSLQARQASLRSSSQQMPFQQAFQPPQPSQAQQQQGMNNHYCRR
jgi:regulator of replication initiation timing